jgi:two-component system response regulator PilR (NtrC family)
MTETAKHLLIVEDEALLREAIAEQLTEHSFQVVQVGTGEEALARLEEFAFDVVLTDLRMPGEIGGSEVLSAALERYPDIVVIVMTGFGTVRDAVAAIRQGASDFLTKPFPFDELHHALRTALERRRLRSENAYLRTQLAERHRFEGLIGRSRPMRELFQVLETISGSSSTILITGETGTGKELVARAIHHNSPRRDQRFVALNCGAIPESLLEAELFGHVRGAFTGAVGNRAGRLEQAHRGTLFLDEVGTMSMALQAKLLRVLQEREFERIGETKPTRIDVRVIAATNSDLEAMVRTGTFRGDLFYRLKVIPVVLPALRDRRDDIPLLVQHFLDRFAGAEREAAGTVGFSQEAMRLLMAFDWPGNVRQLENVVERALALSPHTADIPATALPDEVRFADAAGPRWDVHLPETGLDLEASVNMVERRLILQALDRTQGNKRKAAELLRVKRTTLVEKLKRLNRVAVGAGLAASPASDLDTEYDED